MEKSLTEMLTGVRVPDRSVGFDTSSEQLVRVTDTVTPRKRAIAFKLNFFIFLVFLSETSS